MFNKGRGMRKYERAIVVDKYKFKYLGRVSHKLQMVLIKKSNTIFDIRAEIINRKSVLFME